MRILVISQHYAPEPFIVDKVCEGLVERGHEVTVVTGTPNYPKGDVYDGYEKGKRSDEVINGVKVHRCRILPRKKGALRRLFNYYSFVHASKKYIKQLKEEFDVVFCYQLSPVMQASAAIAYKKKTGVPFVLYCLDIWPESLTVGSFKKTSFVYKHYFKVSQQVYGAADKLLVTSQPFIARLQENFGFEESRFFYLPQHAEDSFSFEKCQKSADEYCDLLFAGNIGLAQSIDTIIHAARLLKDKQNIRFHIVGGGSELEEMKKLSYKLGTSNVFFYGKHPAEKMVEFYAKADGMLVTLSPDEAASMTIPLKVQSYMAAGKPIICAANGAAAAEVEKAACGYVSPAKDADSLASNILRFVAEQDKQALGKRARAYFEANFTKTIFLDRLESTLQETMKKDKNEDTAN